jgi:ribonucleoside-diphosphate reductase alpha chain
MNENIQVTKRNGKKEPVDMEKIHRVVHWASQDLKGVSVSQVEINAQLAFLTELRPKKFMKLLLNQRLI